MATTINAKTWTGEGWQVQATIVLPDGTRSGSEFVELPEDATDEEIAAAVAQLYGE